MRHAFRSGNCRCPATVALRFQNIKHKFCRSGGYEFVGSTVTVSNSDLQAQRAYILQDDGVWHKVAATRSDGEDVYSGPFRAYFRALASNDSPADSLRSRLGEDGEVTDVTVIRVVDSDGDDRYFDLNGRLLPGKPSSGIYIHRGRKWLAR